MKPDTAHHAEEIFLAVIDLPPDRREAEIRARCGGAAALEAEVRSLLACHADQDDFLDPAELRAFGVGNAAPHGPETFLPAGTRIGDFTLVRPIGAGGMGTVYIAEQDRPRRTVALKLVHRGLASPGLLRRFEHEAEVLGRLQHPGIAQIYEAGSAPVGAVPQPYIAMELVDGAALTDYARRNDLGTRDCLALVAAVCDAVHHAHQRGIIHRDLKPANILVTPAGQPKVLDFGVARITDASAHLTTMRTSVGALIGTLAYMSPEQVAGDKGGADTRSDVYALGVMLYQLLTGRLPHDISDKPLPEAARAIREDPPAKPSHVSRIFRGEVDIIVSKALEKDPARRYQSAAELAADLRRHIAGEPISARQDSALYILRKRLKRYRWAVAAAAAGVVALGSFAVYAAISARRERALAVAAMLDRRDAESQRDRANLASQRLEEELTLANVERGRLEATLGNITLAEDLLWKAHLEHPALPAARWGLWELCHHAAITWTTAVSGRPTASAMSEDGSILAVGGRGGTITLYDTHTGRELRRPPSIRGGVNCLVVDRDAGTLFAGSTDGRLAADPLHGARWGRVRVQAHAGGVLAACLSPGRTLLATSGADRRIQLWNASTLEPLLAWETREAVLSLAFSPDGEMLASGSRQAGDSAHMRMWSVRSGAPIREMSIPRLRDVVGVWFAPGGGSLMIATQERVFYRYDLGGGAVVTLDSGANTPISSIAWSPSGRTMLALGRFGASFFDEGQTVARRTVACTRGSPIGGGWADERTVVMVSTDGSVRALDARDEPALTRLEDFPTWCFGVRFSSDGRLAIGAGGSTRLVDPASPSRATETDLPPGLRTRCVRFLKDGRTLLTGSADGAVRTVDAATGRTLNRFVPENSEVYALEISPDESTLALGHGSGVVHLVDRSAMRITASFPKAPRRVEALAWSPDGSAIACSAGPEGVTLLSPLNGARRKLDSSGDPWGLCFSPDGKVLAAGMHDGNLDLYTMPTGERRATLRAHGRLISGLCFSPDGKILVTSSEDGRIKLWDTASQRTVLLLEPRGGEIVDVAMDPTGRYLAAAAALRLTTLYDLRAYDGMIEANRAYQRQRLGVAGGEQ